MGKALRLIAVAAKWNLKRAEEELGDALYPYDPDCLEIVPDKSHPLIYVYSCLSSEKAFEYIVKEPPAYIERLVPVHLLYRGKLYLSKSSTKGLEDFLTSLKEIISDKKCSSCNIEVHPRKIFIIYHDFSRKDAQKHLQKLLGELLGFKLHRRAPFMLVIEDTREGIVVALLPNKGDRLRFWRERRLGL